MKKIRRIKLGSEEMAADLLGSGELENRAILYTLNDGPLAREIVVNQARRFSGSPPAGFIGLREAIRQELEQVDQVFTLRPFRLYQKEDKGKEVPESKTERLARTFGEDTVKDLFNLRVCVIGAGRLGGPMIRGLAAKGASLMVVDKDKVEEQNLPYLPGRAEDFLGEPKANFWADYCSGRYSHQDIVPAYGDVGQEKILNVIKGCDLLVVAIDEAYGRFLTNLLSVQYRIPLLEMGTASEGSWTEDFSWLGRIRFLLPGVNGCLHCVEGLPLDVVAEEATTKLERQLLGEGAQDSENHRPVDYLSDQMAQVSMTKIMSWVAGGISQPVTEFRFEDGRLEVSETSGNSSGECPICNQDGLLGEADREPLPCRRDLTNVRRRN